MKFFFTSVLLLMFCLNAESSSPVQDIKSFNAIVFGNFYPPSNSSSEGRMAVQGDMVISQYGMAKEIPVDDAGVSVIVGGDLTFNSGRIYGGDILVGGSASAVSNSVLYSLGSEQTLLDGVDIPFDFYDTKIRMQRYGHSLSLLPSNGNVSEKYGSLYFYGDCDDHLQIFNITSVQFSEAKSIKVSCVPSTSAVLINISGNSASVSNVSLRGFETNRSRTLYNFYEASVLEFADISIQGSVLAPDADIVGVSGVLYGTVIAGSWIGSMALKMVSFQGLGSVDVECEEGIVSNESE
jgi:choice-of-anchor A domain-containing protein